jgi:DNA modification methylase
MAEPRRWKVSIVGHGEVDPRTLRAHPLNPKEHPAEQDEVVGGSLDELGWVKSVVVNRTTGHVLDGHERIALAIGAGERTVPVEYVEIPAEQEGTALRVLDQSAQLARVHLERWAQLGREYPAPQSGVLRAFLSEQARQQVKAAGVRRDAEGQWKGTWRGTVGGMEGEIEGKAAALVSAWGVESGQVWECGAHRVGCGDALDAGVVQALCGGQRVDVVVTSPPYSIGKGYEAAGVQAHRRLLRGVAARCAEVVKAGGFVVVNFADPWSRAAAAPWTGTTRSGLYPMGQEYWQAFHVEAGWDLYAARVWVKPYARLRQPQWTYHTSLAHQGEWEHVWTWRLPGGEGDTVYLWDVSAHAVWSSIGELDSDAQGPWAHWTAGYPQWLPRQILRAHSAVGMVIWDPFCGAGTTMLACEELGRIGYGSDRDPGAVAVTLERYRQVTGVTPVRVA